MIEQQGKPIDLTGKEPVEAEEAQRPEPGQMWKDPTGKEFIIMKAEVINGDAGEEPSFSVVAKAADGTVIPVHNLEGWVYAPKSEIPSDPPMEAASNVAHEDTPVANSPPPEDSNLQAQLDFDAKVQKVIASITRLNIPQATEEIQKVNALRARMTGDLGNDAALHQSLEQAVQNARHIVV
jgi:hypothetical protein